MELPGQLVPVRLAGLSTKDDAKQLIPGKLVALSNGVFTTPGKIRKRYGSTTLPDTSTGSLVTSITQGNFLANYGSEILLGDGFSLWSYSPSETTWVYKGHAAVAQVTVTPIAYAAHNLTNPQFAQNSTVSMSTWFDSLNGNINLQVKEIATGNVIYGPAAIGQPGSATVGLSCVANLNGTLTAFFCNTSNHMFYATWTGSTLFVGPLGIFPAGFFDVTVNASNYLISYDNTASTGITTQAVTSTFTLGSAYTYTGPGADASLKPISTTWNVSTGLTWVAGIHLTGGGTEQAWLYSLNAGITGTASTIVYGPAVADTILGAAVSSNATSTYIYWSTAGTQASDGHYPFSITYSDTLANIATGSVFQYGVQIASKPWYYTYGTTLIPCIMTWHDSTQQAGYYVIARPLDVTTSVTGQGIVIAKACTETLAGSYGYPLPSANMTGARVDIAGSQEFATIEGKDDFTFGFSGPAQLTFDFSYVNPNTALLNANQIIGGGTVRAYDGVVVNECGFHLYPEYVGATFSSGGSLSAGSYQYAATYEWIDNHGQVHQSAPSFSPSYPGVTAGQKGTIVVPSLDLTDKIGVRVIFWRTVANGTVFYRLSLSSQLPSVPGTLLTYNDTIPDTGTIGIVNNPQLYTTGEAANIPPPPSVVMANSMNRTIIVPSESPTSWWYSKENPPGSPPEFSNEFVNNLDPTGGPITAVNQMDSNLLFMKAAAVYYVAGTGPANSGTGSTYTDAALIPTSSGAINNQVVLTSQGLMYQSLDGIWLLNRSLSDTYIGAEVEQYNGNLVTDATLIPNTTQVRFLTNSGLSLVYDYFANAWSTFTTYSGISAVVANNVYGILTTSGFVIEENKSAFDDSGQFVSLSLTTGWLEMVGLQGFQRVRKMQLLGDWKSSHLLNVQFAYDYATTNTQVDTILVPGLLLPYQFRFFMNVQKCQAIQVTISDSQYSSSLGEGFSLSALAFEVAQKKGLSKNLNPNQSFG